MRWFLLLILSASAVWAQPLVSFYDLGTLEGDTWSYALDVSADGDSIVGHSSRSGNYQDKAFIWRPSAMLSIPNAMNARAISGNGLAVTGVNSDGNKNTVFLWTAANGLLTLPSLEGKDSTANDINENGYVVVGHSLTANGNRAFRWTQTHGIQNLGTLTNFTNWSTAEGVSADGAVVVGTSYSDRHPDGSRAFRWDESNGMQDLGTLSGGVMASARGINTLGTVIVGVSATPVGDRAFKWTENGGMQNLGALPDGASAATAVSADGSVVVGYNYDQTSGIRATIWNAESGTVDLRAYIVSRGINLDGWFLHQATSVSADGSTVVGYGELNGSPRAFAVRFMPIQGLVVEYPVGSGLSNNATSAPHPSTLVGNTSDARVYTMRNSGSAVLSDIVVSKSGADNSHFLLTAPTTNSLGPGASTTFSVSFSPTSSGSRSAQLSITSNDTNNSPFIINLSGFGLGEDLDTDGDAMNDAAEFTMSALGFDWQSNQPTLVAALYSNANRAQLFTQLQYDGNRTNGQTDVATNPAAFNLFTQSQFDGNRTTGQQDVLASPMSYGLYDSTSIMDLRMGGLMLQKQGTDATVVFQPQTTTDLAAQPFTNNGTPVTNTIPMPGNKGFIRVNARPQ